MPTTLEAILGIAFLAVIIYLMMMDSARFVDFLRNLRHSFKVWED